MKKLLMAAVVASFLTACDEGGVISVDENKADSLFNRVDSTAEAVADSAKQEYKELKTEVDSIL